MPAPLTTTDADRLLRFAWQRRDASPAAANVIVERVLSAHPKRADAWHMLGLIAAQQNDSPRALAALKQAATLEQKNLDVRCALAEILIDLLDYKGALKELKVCFELDPKMRHPSGVRARMVVVRLQKEIKRRRQS